MVDLRLVRGHRAFPFRPKPRPVQLPRCRTSGCQRDSPILRKFNAKFTHPSTVEAANRCSRPGGVHGTGRDSPEVRFLLPLGTCCPMHLAVRDDDSGGYRKEWSTSSMECPRCGMVSRIVAWSPDHATAEWHSRLGRGNALAHFRRAGYDTTGAYTRMTERDSARSKPEHWRERRGV